MDAKSYCDSVGVELNVWKTKLYEVMRKAGAIGATGKKRADSIIEELNALVDDLDRRIDVLASECPADWSADKSEIESRMSRMNDKWKEVWGVIAGEEEYGIGGA